MRVMKTITALEQETSKMQMWDFTKSFDVGT